MDNAAADFSFFWHDYETFGRDPALDRPAQFGGIRTDAALNEIGRVQLRVTQPLFVDPYQQNRQTGSFILVDEATNDTVAAGMVRTAKT